MNIISLFAGCGGLDLGFEQAGFHVVWANEFDPAIHETYKLNHPNTPFCGDDIRTIQSNNLPECDGIIGGPPCQSWSIGGKGLGINDERGKLFLDYIRIVTEKKPKFFVIENVAGILEEQHKPAFTMFLDRLQSAGYNVTYSLLNAADFKVPQDRFRIFIIGIRNDLKVTYDFPKPILGDKISLRQTIGDIVDNPSFSESSVSSSATSHGFYNHDVYTGPYSRNYMHSNRVRSWDEVSFTIQAQASNAPQHPSAPKMPLAENEGRMFVKGMEHLYRRLSVRECARIQTFPDSFRFVYTDIKDGYKMVGNAVPPKLAYYIAKSILDAFEKNNEVQKEMVRGVSIDSIAKNHADIIVSNAPTIHGMHIEVLNRKKVDLEKNVLIALVKKDNEEIYLNQLSTIYYTGKRFPSTVALNKLYYFMPYIKGKGVKDIYYIKIARIGSKQEVHPECNDLGSRLVFEIEYVTQLFNTYLPIQLDIWHTYKDTSLDKLVCLLQEE